MLVRRHVEGKIGSEARYSPCERYRYLLTRDWTPARGRLLWIMLNPSTATERANDPTIERCQRRAVQLGFGGISIANLFAFRATRPRDLRQAADPVGEANDSALFEAAESSEAILCGWGIHGTYLGRGAMMAAALRERGHRLLSLGETRDGEPRHPLYVSYKVQPGPFLGDGAHLIRPPRESTE